ncbi:MAG: SRPBCC domain-containing protein [Armatimonadetes bacterium]|nr:SRPBCC domain-containing protein [Armatimonadota bacterium]
MSQELNEVAIGQDQEIVFTRVFNAPRQLVFEAWSNPQHLIHWWGPKGFTNTFHHIEVRAGGQWRFTMHGPDGTDYPNLVVFDEIFPHERIAYTHSPGEENDPDFQVEAKFEDQGENTRLTLTMRFASTEARNNKVEFGVLEGGAQTLDRLGDALAQITTNPSTTFALALPSDREIVMTRLFNAPRELVFEAWTNPEHVAKWWGGCAQTVLVCESDLRVGGQWRTVLQEPGGAVHPFKGVFQEIASPELLVHTMIYDVEPYSNIVAVVTVTFREEDGKTRMIERIQHESVEARNGHLASGMEWGAVETLNRLEVVLEEMSREQ